MVLETRLDDSRVHLVARTDSMECLEFGTLSDWEFNEMQLAGFPSATRVWAPFQPRRGWGKQLDRAFQLIIGFDDQTTDGITCSTRKGGGEGGYVLHVEKTEELLMVGVCLGNVKL